MISKVLKRIFNFKKDPKVEAFTFGTENSAHELLPDLVLYYFPQCIYCKRVLRVIDELSLDIPLRDIRKEKKWKQDLINRTGQKQVPCLFIEGTDLFESKDIISYLKSL
jgi:glutaredoxin